MTKPGCATVLCAIIYVTAFSAKVANATSLNYFLTIDVINNTWELAASTDAPGGIGSILVNLINYGTGHSVAPRGQKGFTVGNNSLPSTSWPSDHENYNQCFAAQMPVDIESMVFGVGYVPIPDIAFGVLPSIAEMQGSAQNVPTVFYIGSYDPANGLPDFASEQPFSVLFNRPHPGVVYVTAPPPGGFPTAVFPNDVTYRPEFATYSARIVPEPSAWLSFLGSLILASYGTRLFKSGHGSIQ
ncbi:MAG: hypothetical protein IT427_18995 [Pirellulales bacterium]|nr:hypothetical protein [Pirellulales bacterium]